MAVIASMFPDSSLKEMLKRKIIGNHSDKPEIPLEARHFLQEIFMEDMKRLEDLLERPIPWNWLAI